MLDNFHDAIQLPIVIHLHHDNEIQLLVLVVLFVVLDKFVMIFVAVDNLVHPNYPDNPEYHHNVVFVQYNVHLHMYIDLFDISLLNKRRFIKDRYLFNINKYKKNRQQKTTYNILIHQNDLDNPIHHYKVMHDQYKDQYHNDIVIDDMYDFLYQNNRMGRERE